jgi:LAO/AO transport system kinase
VVNKADRPGASVFLKNLRQMLAPAFNQHTQEIPVLKTVASKKEGITELVTAIYEHRTSQNEERKNWLLAEKAYQLIKNARMKDVSKELLKKEIESKKGRINLYEFIKPYC